MLKVEYSETFLKDLKKLKSTPYYRKIKRITFDELSICPTIKEIKNLKKLKGMLISSE